MVHLSNKRFLFVSSILLLFALSSAIPIAKGAPTNDLATAELHGNGTHIGNIPGAWNHTYFNISGQVGDFVTVVLTYVAPTWKFSLYFRNQSGDVLKSDDTPDGYQSVQVTLTTTEQYTIYLWRSDGNATSTIVTLMISGLTEVIPGFEFLLGLLSVIGILGLLYIQKSRKSPF